MRTFTTKHIVYKLDELSEEAKGKALENLYDINVDCDWWDYSDYLILVAKEYGIELSMTDLCFDIYHREFYLDLHDHSHDGHDKSCISDERQFLRRAGIDLRSAGAQALIRDGIGLTTKHYGGGSGATKIDIDHVYTEAVTEEIEDKLQNTLQEFEQECLSVLREQYDSLTSEEAIADTINANEYEFYADGSLA